MADSLPAASPSTVLPALVLIAAVARNGVIGAANSLPWRLPDDMRRFKALTSGHTVIMGRRTWQSLPRPLPNRQNIVLSSRADLRADGAEVVSSLPAALRAATLPRPVYCIGGGEIYALAMPLADRMEITEIDTDVSGDTHFPPIDGTQWRVVERTAPIVFEGLRFCFVSWQRIDAAM